MTRGNQRELTERQTRLISICTLTQYCFENLAETLEVGQPSVNFILVLLCLVTNMVLDNIALYLLHSLLFMHIARICLEKGPDFKVGVALCVIG